MPSDLAFYRQNAFLCWTAKKFPEKFSPPLTCGFVDFARNKATGDLRVVRKSAMVDTVPSTTQGE